MYRREFRIGYLKMLVVVDGVKVGLDISSYNMKDWKGIREKAAKFYTTIIETSH
jgi:hypothetical protein